MEISKIYPLDAVFDSPEDVPEDVCSYFSSVIVTSNTIDHIEHII